MTVVERGAVVAVALLVARGALSVMMWHTRSVTFLVVMYRSCLVMELQTRESGATVRVALLSRCKMPVRAPRNTTITCGARGHTSACGGERHVVCGGRRGCWLVRVAPASSSKAAQADHLEHAHEQKKVAKCRDVREHTHGCVAVEHVDRERRAATRFVHPLQGSSRGQCGDTLVHRMTKRRHTKAQARAEHVGARTGGLGGSRLRELDHHSRDLTRSGFVLVRLLIEYLRRADEHG